MRIMFCLAQEVQQIQCLYYRVNVTAVREEEQYILRSYHTIRYSKVAPLLTELDTNLTQTGQGPGQD